MKEDETNEILEEVRGIKGAVETRIDTMETGYKKDLSDLKQYIEDHKGETMDKAALEGHLTEILQKQTNENKTKLALPGGGYATTGGVKIPAFWKGEYVDFINGATDFDPAEVLSAAPTQKAFDAILQAPAVDDNTRYLQELATDVWILDAVAKCIAGAKGKQYPGFAEQFPKMSKLWGKYASAYLGQYGQKFDSSDVANWVPTRFTGQVMELIKIELRVAALFERFTMPASPFTWPVDLTDEEPILVAEVGGVVNPWDDTVVNTPEDELVTFTARKLRARFLMSGEVTEDSIVPILPRLRSRLIEIMAQGQERFLMDGDRSATHMDNDTDGGAANLVQKSIAGLRFFCQDNSYTTDVSGDTDSVAMLSTRKSLGEHGAVVDKLAHIVGISQSVDMLSDVSVQTVDKFGPSATILNGELGKVHGVPAIVSRKVREDVAATGVNTVGGPNTKTYHITVHRDVFMIGDRRNPTLESERLLNTDQINIVSFNRLDFQYMYGGTAKTVAWQGINTAP